VLARSVFNDTNRKKDIIRAIKLVDRMRTENVAVRRDAIKVRLDRRTALPFDAELQLDSWVTSQRAKGLAVRNEDIISKALELAGSYRVQGFKASRRWAMLSRNRWYLARRKASIQHVLPEDFRDRVFRFRKTVLQMRKMKRYALGDIVHWDQTMVRFAEPGGATIDRKGRQNVRISTSGREKKGATVVPVANALGEKLLLVIILKEQKGLLPKTFLKDKKHETQTKVFGSNNGWQQTPLVVSMVHALPDLNGRPGLVVIDGYAGHTSKETSTALKEKGYDVVYGAAGCSAITNPADATYNAPLKSFIRKEWHRARMQAAESGAEFKPTRQWFLSTTEAAWSSISDETIRKGFLMAGISNALDGTQDDWIFEQSCHASSPDAIEDAVDDVVDEADDTTEVDEIGCFGSDCE